MPEKYQDLGIFSDWVEEAQRQGGLFPWAKPGIEVRQKLREVLGFNKEPDLPQDVRSERRWVKDGVEGEELSWGVGYGPRTHAYLFRPAGVQQPLPGLLALHDHGAFKYYGKEKIADGPEDAPVAVKYHRESAYGNRAFVNALAQEGFVVLVHDTFTWGSRRFPLEEMPATVRTVTEAVLKDIPGDPTLPREVVEYNEATTHHEHIVEKYCNLLGTTFAGMVSHEDRIALNYLRSRPEAIPQRLGCIGLSGGGNRSALLLATSDYIRAAVIVGLMSTYPGLLDHNVACHTWMLFPHGWSRYGDWPDIAASRAPMPLLAQYDLEDELFTVEGMRTAHERIQQHYRNVGRPEAYTGQFYPGPHKFDLEMQAEAFDWLKHNL